MGLLCYSTDVFAVRQTDVCLMPRVASVCASGGAAIPKDDILYMPCDVLIPAAIGGVIDETNAGRLSCKYVAEAANGPTTPQVWCMLDAHQLDKWVEPQLCGYVLCCVTYHAVFTVWCAIILQPQGLCMRCIM